ncbi:MAG: tail sheath stabilizer and completion protein, partial [Minisyncoccia bacterium]
TNDRSIVYTPVPYNIDVKVSVITNRTDDACEIGEQIIPLFTPDIKIAAKNLLENSDHIFDLSLNLDFINTNDNYEGELTKRRLITWEFNFTFKNNFKIIS